jgi:hypothetical protein
MNKVIVLICCFLFFISACHKSESVSAPAPDKENISSKDDSRTCASAELLEKEIGSNPGRAAYLEALETKIASYAGRNTSTERLPGKLYLPVVIHIVLTDPSVISNATIVTQLQLLNLDLNKNNPELANSSVYLAGYKLSSVANCQIEPYVTDVVRVVTSVAEFSLHGDSMKVTSLGGSDPIDPVHKLNIWVCNTPGGYSWAKFPGGPVQTDGIVIDYAFFGPNTPAYPNHNGRVAIHELGHWLNLRHIWGDADCGTDGVNDTPIQPAPNYYCPAAGLKSTCRTKPLMMWMNYMDYSYGNCKYMFTSGQKQRMDATIDNARSTYFSTTKIFPGYF